MTSRPNSFLLILMVALLAGACGGDEENVAPTDDNEAITTAILTLTSQTTPAPSVTATLDNLNATADASRATLTLRTNTTYAGVLTLLDKTQTPPLDVSAEVRAEANEHLIVYTFTPATGSPASLTVTATDRDTNPAPGPYPLGLVTQVQTGPAGTGQLNVVLKHQPGVKNGSSVPGTTDLDVNFTVIVQ